MYVQYIYVNASKTRVCVGGVGAFSLGAAGGSTGLVEAHGFAQPASKVHFLHFGSFDERVTLEQINKKETILYTASIIKPKHNTVEIRVSDKYK